MRLKSELEKEKWKRYSMIFRYDFYVALHDLNSCLQTHIFQYSLPILRFSSLLPKLLVLQPPSHRNGLTYSYYNS